MEVRPERSGWRDLELSNRHRKWGWDCPAIDIDFLMIEYDHSQPIALVEYKHEYAPKQDLIKLSSNYKALRNLGNMANIPVLFVRYKNDFSIFRAVPLNNLAKNILPEPKDMSERQWVTFLHEIRGYKPPEELFEGAKLKI